MALDIFVATLAAVLGAGFASGREVWVFFGVHGPWAPVLGAFATTLLAAAAYRTTQRAMRDADPFGTLFGRYRAPARLVLSLFSLLTFAAVVAVLGSLGHAYWGIPQWAGSLVSAAIAAGLAAAGHYWQRRLQGLLLSGVLLCVFLASALAMGRPSAPLHVQGTAVPWGAAVGVFGFVAYNIALAADGIARSAVRGANAGPAFAAAGGLMAGVLLTLEATALSRHGALVGHADLPLVVLAASIHGLLGAVVAVTVLLAGLSAASSFAVGAGPHVRGPWGSAAAAFALSLIGVQGIVDRGYPLMAAVAGIWLGLLFWAPPKRRITVICKAARAHSFRGR